MNFSGYQGNLISKQATIAISETESDVIPLKGFSLVGIKTPDALTGTALTFLACDTEDGTFLPLIATTGSALSITVTTDKYYAVDPLQFHGVGFLKIVSGSAEAAARTLICSLKGF